MKVNDIIRKDIGTPEQIPTPAKGTLRMPIPDTLNQSINIWIPCMPRILMNHKYPHHTQLKNQKYNTSYLLLSVSRVDYHERHAIYRLSAHRH